MNWEHSLFRTLYLYFYAFKLTRFGKMLVLFGLLAGMVVVWSVEVMTFYLLSAMFALGVFSLAVNLAWRTRFDLRMRLPDRVAAGTVLTGTVHLRNAGRFPAYDVGAAFFGLPAGIRNMAPESYVAALAPGETAALPLSLHAARRGSYTLPQVRAFSAFPLRLLRSGASKQAAGKLLVLPAFAPAEGVEVPVSPRYQPGGVTLTSNIGESPEYMGNRMYQPGDSIRRIDMRAWARVGAPVVREYQEEYFLRLAVVLDTYVAGSRLLKKAEDPALEAAVSLTATLVDALSRGEYLLDIFAAGPELYNFRTGRGSAPFDSVLEILACIDACRSNPFDIVTPALADELGNISTVLFVFLDWDASRRDMVRIASECGCRTRVFIIRDGNTSLPAVSGEETPLSLLTPAQVSQGGFGVL